MKKVLGLVLAVLFICCSMAQAEEHYGKINVAALNNGSLQIKGVTWCKKYFDLCVVKEKWMGPTLQSRETATVLQFVTMQTGVLYPDIKEVDDVGTGKLRIVFVYDQTLVHEPWIPEYKEVK